MRYLFIFFLVLFALFSCNNDSKNPSKACSPQNPNGKCENGKICNNGICINKNTCKEECPENSECKEGECKCNDGFVMFEGKCIVDMCLSPSPCTEENKTVCKPKKDKPYFICECDEGYHEENTKCVSNENNPCYPNPCKEKHKTRCLLNPEDNSKYECHCDASYHSEGDICCPAFSHAENGECKCNEHYIKNPESEELSCIILCSQDSVEGFHGWCEDGKVCIDGICKTDLCKNKTCPENSTCIVREDTAQCQCNSGLHLDNGLCCPQHSSNINGECKCDEGYILSNGICNPVQNNPCETNGNPCTELHKNKCIVINNGNDYRCECNEGYREDNGECKLITEGCGEGFICLNNYCVREGQRPNEQCLSDNDCNWNGTDYLYCVSSALGGICNGCINDTDCPGDLTICTEYGSCNKICENDNDCPSGNCMSTGYCGRARCTTNQDCPYGSACIEGWCNRKPCEETECSVYNPNGNCKNGKTCIYGNCVDSCNPNPCNKIPMKTVCKNEGGSISCECENGYTENDEGKCIPLVVNECPDGFVCENGYCADRNDSGFVCSGDEDCGVHTTCSTPMTLPSGKCTGCEVKADCPHTGTGDDAVNPFECIAGYCILTCVTQSDCNNGMICKNGYCSKKECSSSDNCPYGYICNGSSLKCERIPCSE